MSFTQNGGRGDPPPSQFRLQSGYESIFPRGKNGDSPLVINSNFWKSHFLSGEKTGAASQPWAGPGWAGLRPRFDEIRL